MAEEGFQEGPSKEVGDATAELWVFEGEVELELELGLCTATTFILGESWGNEIDMPVSLELLGWKRLPLLPAVVVSAVL